MADHQSRDKPDRVSPGRQTQEKTKEPEEAGLLPQLGVEQEVPGPAWRREVMEVLAEAVDGKNAGADSTVSKDGRNMQRMRFQMGADVQSSPI